MVLLFGRFLFQERAEPPQAALGKPDRQGPIGGTGLALHRQVLLQGFEQVGGHRLGHGAPGGSPGDGLVAVPANDGLGHG